MDVHTFSQREHLTKGCGSLMTGCLFILFRHVETVI